MIGFGTFIDNNAIMDVIQPAPRDQAIKMRDALRQLLRAIEDTHGLPHSFETQKELEARLYVEGRPLRQKP